MPPSLAICSPHAIKWLTRVPPRVHPRLQRASHATHLSTDIQTTVIDQQAYATTAFLAADEARTMEDDRRAGLAAAAKAAKEEAEAAAIEAARVRKDPNCISFHGGFQERFAKQTVPVGGATLFSGSAISGFMGEAPPYAKPPKPATPAMDPTLPVATGDGGFHAADDDALAASAANDASKLLASPFDTARSGGMTTVPPLKSDGGATTKLSAPFAAEPPALPPPAMRLSTRMPPRVTDGGVRAVKPVAPIVSEPPAQANPNLLNLLLEVPYKRGVHTVSVNQRYLNHEPTFDAAFELLPSHAAFGVLRAPCLYRFKLLLTNVSNLPQRFVIKHGQQARVVYTPGVAAAGLSVPLEIEIAATDANVGDLAENLTIVTEREEILLPVSATILTAEQHDEHGRPPPAPGVRMLATAPRDPKLSQTVPLMTGDFDSGTKRFTAPVRDPERTGHKLRPDFDDDFSDPEDEPSLS